MTKDQKLQRFAEREFKKYLGNIVFQDTDNDYIAFGYYQIKTTGTAVEVRNVADDVVGIFSNKRAALGYCTADKYQKFALASQIKNLDQKKQLLANDLRCARSLVEKIKQPEFRHTVNVKTETKNEHYKSVCAELEKCINLAKYLQIKGFQNETARVFSN